MDPRGHCFSSDSSYSLIDGALEGLGQSPDCGQWVSRHL